MAQTSSELRRVQDRRRRAAKAAMPLPPIALLAACGAGGGAGPAVGTPAVSANAETTSVPAGATETSGNLLVNASTTGGTAVIAAVTGPSAAPAPAGSSTPAPATPPPTTATPAPSAGAPATVAPTDGAAATIQGNLGQLVVQPNGSYTYQVNPAAAAFTALGAGETTTETFIYTPAVAGNAGKPQTLTITITGVNDAPTPALDDGGVASAGTAVNGNVLANDSDPDKGTTLSVIGVSAGAGTSAGDGQRSAALLPPVSGTYGTLTMAEDGSYSYMVSASDVDTLALGAGKSATEMFTYTVSDGSMTRTATLRFSVSGSNDAPTLVADTGSGVANQSVTGNVLGNDSDVDGDALTVAGFSAGGGVAGTLGTPFATPHGALTLAANGAYSFSIDPTKPAVIALKAGQTATESFTYTASDGTVTQTSTLTITITGGNDAPIPTADVGAAVAGATITGNLITNDGDPDADPLSVTALAGPGGLTGTIGQSLSTPLGALTVNANGSYSYVADATKPAAKALAAGATASEVFTYSVSDGSMTGSATFTVTVTGTNDAPTAVADTVAGSPPPAPSGPFLTGNLLANDSDPDGTTVTLVSIAPSGGGPLSLNAPFYGTYGALTPNSDGSFTYIIDNSLAAVGALRPGESATEAFTYVITDGATTASSTLTVTINGVNDAPVAELDWFPEIRADATLTGNVLANDTDRDPGTTLTVVSASRVNGTPIPLGQPYSFTHANGSGDIAVLTINADGSFTAVPDPVRASRLNAGQLAVAEYYYTVGDGTATATAILRFQVRGVDDPVVLTADSVNVLAGGTVSGSVTTNDSDPDEGEPLGAETIKGSGSAVPAHGGAVSGSYGAIKMKGDGTFSYTTDGRAAPLKAGEVATDIFTYTLRGQTATLTVNVTGIDDPIKGGGGIPLTAQEGAGPTALQSLFINGNQNGGSGLRIFDPDDTLFIKSVNGQAIETSTPTKAIRGTFGDLVVGTGTTGTFSYVVDDADPDLVALLPGQMAIDYFSYQVGTMPGGSGSPDFAGIVYQQVVASGTRAHGTGGVYVINAGAEIPRVLGSAGGSDTLIVRGTLGEGTLGAGDNDAILHLDTGIISGVIDGGAGTDTLRLVDNSGATITPTQFDLAARLENFEKIELAGSGSTTLIVRVQDVLDATGAPNTLRVLGEAGDRVDLDTGWALGADQTIDGQLYHSYTSGGATLLLDPDLLVI